MDAATLTALVKELNEANAGGKTLDVVRLLKKLKAEVIPSEDILRPSKAGVAVGKLRTHASSEVQALSKELVKYWKEVIEENKKKRKRDEGDKDKEKDDKDTKRIKEAASRPDSPAKKEDGARDEGKSGPALSTIDSSRKTPRTAKLDGIANKLRASDEADDFRSRCVVQLYDALAGDSVADNKVIGERAVSIERAVYEQFEGTGNDYRAKVRSLFLNLKDKGNPGLRNEIVLGYITAEKLIKMSKEEMASESVRALNEKIASENLFKAKAVGETQAETDAFKCARCQQRKCTYYQMQTRSADEPMTMHGGFFHISKRGDELIKQNCGNRWKFS